MPLAQPPKKDDPGYDDWMWRFYKQTSASSTASSNSFPGANRHVTNGNAGISSGYSAYVPDFFEIASGNTLILTGTLEIG